MNRRRFLQATLASATISARTSRADAPSTAPSGAADADLSCVPAAHDLEFFDRELRTFIPDHVFDAHAHLWRSGHVPDAPVRGDVGLQRYHELVAPIHGGGANAGLFIPAFHDATPGSGGEALQAQANAWVAGQVRPQSSPRSQAPVSRGLFFVRPDDEPEQVREQVRRLGLCGLKCYHTFARARPTWDAQIPDYLPERLVKVAHEERWVITLHMVRSRAVADPGNIHWIRAYCERYPDMRLILAHAARGFQPAHNLEGLPQLRGLGNLYFDSSANCEPIALQAILRILGHERLMYGTDFPTSHMRGRSVAAADSFLWLRGDVHVWGEKHARIQPVLVGLEHLRALKWACWSERLTDMAVEDIFHNTAAELLGVTSS